MGLLDNIVGTSIDDPKTMATMQLVQGLLSPGGAMRGLSTGLLGYGQQMTQSRREQQLAEMQKLQLAQHQMALQQAQRQQAVQAQQDQFRASIPSPQMLASQAAMQGGGPTVGNASRMAPVSQDAQLMHGALQAGLIDPVQYIASQRKDTAPLKLGAGEGLYDPRTFKPLVVNPKEDTTPSAVKEYQFAKLQGYPGTFQQFVLEQKRAGASSVSVSMDKGFGDAFAKDAATALANSRDKAKGAAGTLQALARAEQAIGSGNVVSGPGANVRTTLLQLGQILGANGKDDTEKLANTRNLMQASASLAVDGAQALAGQGQITDAERALVSRMAGGNLDSMTVPEIKVTLSTLRKINTAKIQAHNAELAKVGPQFKAFAPFYAVQAPALPDAGPSSGWSITPR